jgi:hypothetical protein
VQWIREAAICVADLTGNNPNVMWESGFAMALDKPTILIGQAVETMPFDLKVHRLLIYDRERLDELEAKLVAAIEHTLPQADSRRLYDRPAHLYWLGHDLARSLRFIMYEHLNRVELERNLNGALFHLDRLQLVVPEYRSAILKALWALHEKFPWSEEDRRTITGWIA